MKIALISDLHLAPEPTNRCTASVRELLDLFDILEERADRVVVAGDIFDLDRPRVPGAWRAQLAQTQAAFPQVYQRLEAYDWVVGNHDQALRHFGVPQERCFMGADTRALICHGHRWDMLLKKLPGLASGANFVAGWLERGGFAQPARRLARVPLALDDAWHQIKPGQGRAMADESAVPQRADQARPDRGLRGARSLLANSPWDIVACGHSHRLRLDAGASGLFVNTGSICQGHIDWALIDLGAPGSDAPKTRDQNARDPSVELWRDGALFARAHKARGRWVRDDI